MKQPIPVLLDRVREIPESFSWIDRRLITDCFLPYLTRNETALYFFLVTVSNRHGMSFYGQNKICFHTGLDPNELERAKRGLEEIDLVAFRFPFYQALSQPDNREGMNTTAGRFAARRMLKGTPRRAQAGRREANEGL